MSQLCLERSMTGLGFRDIVRLALYIAIPVYTRKYLFSSILATFGHTFILGTTGVSIACLSSGRISLGPTSEVLYGMRICSFPDWAPRILGITWLGENVEGWQWEVVYWTFAAAKLAYFLPDKYGNDVKVLRKEPRGACGCSRFSITVLSGAIVLFVLWPERCPWHGAARMLLVIISFLQHACLAFLNHVYFRRFGKSAWETSEDLLTPEGKCIFQWIYGAFDKPDLPRT